MILNTSLNFLYNTDILQNLMKNSIISCHIYCLFCRKQLFVDFFPLLIKLQLKKKIIIKTKNLIKSLISLKTKLIFNKIE